MKTIILLTGHARTLERTAPNQWWYCWRHFPEPVFIASLVEDDDSAKAQAVLSQFGRPVFVERIQQPNIAIPEGEPWAHAAFAIASTPQGILRQIWHLYRGREYAREVLGAQEPGDIWVRCRPDLWWWQAVRTDNMLARAEVLVPDWGQFGGINDRFAVMTDAAAEDYFGAWLKLPALLSAGCPLHPETIMAEAVSTRKLQRARFWFATLRKDGQLRAPEYIPGEK